MSTSKEEIEQKKWLISRIDLYHKTMRQTLDNDLKKYESYIDKISATFRGYRITILSILGIILATIFGINSAYPIDLWIIYVVLAIMGIAALITIIIFTLLSTILNNIFETLIFTMNKNIGNIAQSQGFFITRAADLYGLPFQYVSNYFYFTLLLSSAILVSSSKSLKKLAKDYSKIPQIKTLLEEEAKLYLKNIELVSKYFEKFTPSDELPKELLDFVDKELSKYKPKN